MATGTPSCRANSSIAACDGGDAVKRRTEDLHVRRESLGRVALGIDRDQDDLRALRRGQIAASYFSACASSASVVGQTSGQLVKPKNSRLQWPRSRSALNGLPS